MTELEAFIALNAVYGIGPRKILDLLNHFGSPSAVFGAGAGDILAVHGFGGRTLDALKTGPDLEFAQNQIKRAAEVGASIITLRDPAYPEKLKRIYDPPILLHVKGNARVLHEPDLVAVVGTRKPTRYGRDTVHGFVTELCGSGVAVVSGMARGIDAAAHRAALDAKGRTIAVLGCGLDFFYPYENVPLAHAISQNGALVSEFPFGTPPEPGHFPRRNRIISGLSAGVLVVEAGQKSGALITADYAMEQGINVYSVPGNIDSPVSVGANRLIRDGAVPALEAGDILMNLGKKPAPAAVKAPSPGLDGEEAKIFGILTSTPLHIDEIIRLSNTKPNRLHAILLSLEVKGMASQVSGMKYVRAHG
jgi:DNA processing protein